MKLFRFSFLRRLITLALLIGLVLGNASFSRGDSTAKISVRAVVLPKTPSVNYKKLHETLMSKIEDYSKKAGIGNQEKYLKATVYLDFPEGNRGIVIEVEEDTP